MKKRKLDENEWKWMEKTNWKIESKVEWNKIKIILISQKRGEQEWERDRAIEIIWIWKSSIYIYAICCCPLAE